jgi:phosphopentomutase
VGERDTLSDIAATVAQFFSVPPPENGNSFYSLIR